MPDTKDYYLVRVDKCLDPLFRTVRGALVTGKWQPTDEDGFTRLILTTDNENNPIAEYERFLDFVAEEDPALVDAFIFIENMHVAQDARNAFEAEERGG